MNKILALIIAFAFVFSLVSCSNEPDTYRLLCEFVKTYGAEGVIYYPDAAEGEDGYITKGFIEKIYLFYGSFPDNFAILLNSRTDYSSECGIFFCDDAEMLQMVEEMCLERIRLICHGDDRAFVKRSGKIVFYSTMPDRVRAERIFSEIIR